MNTWPIQREDDDAIRQLVQDMQDGQNTKNGQLFASAFAQEHDYVAIHGMFLPNQTREDNARIHQRFYDESNSSVARRYGEVEVRLTVAKIRLLASGGAVVHVRSELHLKCHTGEEDQEHHNRCDAGAAGRVGERGLPRCSSAEAARGRGRVRNSHRGCRHKTRR